MEKWTFRRYSRPYLAVDSVGVDDEAGQVIVVSHGEVFEIAIADGVIGTDTILDQLHQLRDPMSELWGELRGSNDSDGCWNRLVQQMDELSLIEEYSTPKDSAVGALDELEAIVELAETLPGQMMRGVAATAHLRANMAIVEPYAAQLVQELLAECGADSALETRDYRKLLPNPFVATDNFYIRTVLWQLQYWRRAAPVTLLSVWHAMRIVSEERGVSRDSFRQLASHLWCGIYSLRDCRQSILGFASLMSWSTGADSRAMAEYEFVPTDGLSSLGLIVKAEQITNRILASFGIPRYLVALRNGTASKPLISGCYVEEYHVTTRFVEIITPMLSKRIREPLRSRLFRYYAEEVGHEVFERDTCISLGIDSDVLSRLSPLPLHAAFVDTFTHFASVDPLGYLLSIFVTEGMLGVTSPIGEALEKVDEISDQFRRISGRHDSLNEDLNHASLSRLMLADVLTPAASCQSRAIGSLAHLLELNFRAWERLYDHYSPMTSIEQLCGVVE